MLVLLITLHWENSPNSSFEMWGKNRSESFSWAEKSLEGAYILLFAKGQK